MAKKAINEFNENEKVRPIVIHDTENGRDYTLEFDLESVRFAQARGFDSDDIGKFPVIKTEELFYYAFRKNHKNVPKEKTDKILWEGLGGIGNLPDGFIERLIMLYYDPINAVKSAEEEGKNAKVTVEM
jgi:hypothetical protein